MTVRDVEVCEERSAEWLLAEAAVPGADRGALLDEVVVRHLDLARNMARSYRDRSLAVDDLEQVACLALVRAAHDFDPSRGHDFLSYAVPTIRGSLRRHFRDHGWTIRPPRRVQQLQTAALAVAAALEGTDPRRTVDRVADALGAPVADVEEALAARGCFVPESLDRRVAADGPGGAADGAGGSPLGELLEDAHRPGHLAAEARVVLRAVLPQLGPTERLVLYRRFFEDRPQREIAEELGTTQMTVSRMLKRILADLRRRIGDGEAWAA